MAAGSGQSLDEISPYRLSAPASPHLAAELEGLSLEPARIIEAARRALDSADLLVCEGIGGLLVPLTTGYTVRDLALELGLPLTVVARPSLGTINHTLLTLEAARAAGLRIAHVVFNQWPEKPGKVEQSNRETVERLGEVSVLCLPRLPRSVLAEPSPGALAPYAERYFSPFTRKRPRT